MENHHQLPANEHLHEEHFHPLKQHRPDVILEELYAIVPVYNPHRYRSMWKHYKDTEEHLLRLGFHVVTMECSFGVRQPVLTKQREDKYKDKHTVIHVFTENEVWMKERLINLAVQQLPNPKYICWIDGDLQFVRKDIVGETLHKLQHYHVVQMFSVAHDLTPNFMTYQINYGYVHDVLNGIPDKTRAGNWEGGGYYTSFKPGDKLKAVHHHPGFAWAYTVEAWNALGGMLDTAILGSADRHMACALFGQYEKSVPAGVSKGYKESIRLWQERALEFVKKDVGYVEGQVNHLFHGSKSFRRYKDRWKIIVNRQFDPYKHLKPMFNGTWQLDENEIGLRDDLRAYFAQRNQDDISLQPNEKPIGL